MGAIVATMTQSMECEDLETFITCCDIVVNLIHKGKVFFILNL
jgi:hypothetical protein